MTRISLVSLMICVMVGQAFAGENPSPAGAKTFIVNLKNGDVVHSPFTVVFGLEGMRIAPAGTRQDNTGHYHLIINAKLPPMDEPIPDNAHYKHFGKGQTETRLALPPGKHTLQVLLGDWTHVPHNPPVYSQPTTIMVQQ